LSTDKPETADLLRELSVLEGSPCSGCERPLCGHQSLVALVMGFKCAPRCAECLAASLALPLDRFLDQVVGLVHHRDCYRSGWEWADRRENLVSSARPDCLQPSGAASRKPRKTRRIPSPDPGALPAEAAWDAGSMGCGDLVLELRLRLSRVAPGGILKVTALDPGAPEDLPAWCRLTGHALVESNHPNYCIRRKPA
jgi:tRNA 2-thiouridine synthesizing protein A